MALYKIASLILAETPDWLALNKPSGLLSVPDREGKEPSLKTILKEKYGNIFVVHRLDRDTSGAIVFAKTPEAHRHLSIQFEERQTEKYYEGLVLGVPAEEKQTVDAPIMEHPVKKGLMTVHRKGKPSKTDFQLLESFGRFSWMRFRIYTGRTHQIRVHAKHIGHPILCDELYGDGKPLMLSDIKMRYKLSKNQDAEVPLLSRLALHASKLVFTDLKGNAIDIDAPLPKDIRASLQQLRKILDKRY